MAAAEVDQDAKALAEELFRRVCHAVGHDTPLGRHTLELVFQDGELARFFRHEGPVPAAVLLRAVEGTAP